MSIQDDTEDSDKSLQQSRPARAQDELKATSDVQKVKEDVATILRGIRAASNDSTHVAADYMRTLKASGTQKLESLEDHIRTKPNRSVAIAFLIGAAASYLLRRRST